jgi:hypothetical protein
MALLRHSKIADELPLSVEERSCCRGTRMTEFETQSGHSGYSAAIGPGAFTWDAILRRTMSM